MDRRALLAALLLALPILPLPAAGAAEQIPVPLATTEPFAPNVRVTFGTSPYSFQVEPMLALNASGALFLGWKEALTHDGPGQRIGFSRSLDGGAMWSPEVLMDRHNDALLQSDPWLVVDEDDFLYYTWIEHSPPSGVPATVPVARSLDGGVTWDQVTIASLDTCFTDKEMLYGDRQGHLYLAYDDVCTSSFTLVARSDDDGATWTNATQVNDAPGIVGPFVTADLNGTVYDAWLQYSSSDILVDRSSDGGATWGTDVRVNDVPGSAEGDLFGQWKLSIPSLVSDAAGTLYVAWTDVRGGSDDIYVSRSTDQAQTWAPAVRINDDPAYDQWQVQLAVGPDGTIHAAWMDERAGDARHVYYANSTDGGRTWSPNVRVTTMGTSPAFTRPGDYLALVVGPDNRVYVAWTDGRRGADLDIYFASYPAPAGVVEYTVDTAPSGLEVSVDGDLYRTPARFGWIPGSLHTVSASTNLDGPDHRWVFASWSDGEPATHSVVAPAFGATLVATFDEEWLVTVTSDPPGRLVTLDGASARTPAGRWWGAGTFHGIGVPEAVQHGVEETPVVCLGCRWIWQNWSDGGPQNHTVLVNGSQTFTARFRTQYLLSAATDPAGVPLALDGGPFPAPGIYLDAGTAVNLSAPEFEYLAVEERLRWREWSDGGPRERTVLMDTYYFLTASYDLEFFLNVTSTLPSTEPVTEGTGWYVNGSVAEVSFLLPPSPANGSFYAFEGWTGDAAGNATTLSLPVSGPMALVAGASLYHNLTVDPGNPGSFATGSGSYRDGSWAPINLVDSYVCAPTIGFFVLAWCYRFQGWSGGASNLTVSAHVYMDEAKTVTGSWEFLAFVGVCSYELRSLPFRTIGEGYYPPGTNVTLRVNASTIHYARGSRIVFEGWEGYVDDVLSLPVTEPTCMTPRWRVEHLLTVESDLGTPEGGGWYAEGDTALARVPEPVDAAPGRTRWRFAGWTGSVESALLPLALALEAPASVRATWTREHYVDVRGTCGAVGGAGWYPEGSVAVVTAEASAVGEDGPCVFGGWTGSVTSSERERPLVVDGPITVTATSRPREAPAEVPNLALLAIPLVIGAVVLFALVARRRRRSQ